MHQLLRPRPLLLTGTMLVCLTVPLAGSASAAAVTSRADAEALSVSAAGQGGQGSGRVEATYDGQESVSGDSSPTIPGGGFLSAGVLTQQATAGNGTAAACAGLVANGEGVIQIGEGACLRPGATLQGSLTDLSLGGLAGEIDQLPAEVRGPLAEVLGQVDAAVEQVVAPIADQAGDLGLRLDLDAVEGRCTSDDGTLSGSASIANARLVGQVGDREVTLVTLPANPAPNTRVVTDLSAVVDVLLSGVETDLRESFDGQLSEVAKSALAPVREQLVAAIRDNLEEQLAPLEDNVVRVVLNEQTRPTSDSLRVTALHAEVLPVAAEQLGGSLLDVRIGSVGCGPADRVVTEEPAPERPQAAPPASKPRLPTAVSAGLPGESRGHDDAGGVGMLSWLTLAAGASAAAGAGVSAVRRRRA